MIGVDLIGQIRRAYFDQHRPIKEIVRALSVSRATVCGEEIELTVPTADKKGFFNNLFGRRAA